MHDLIDLKLCSEGVVTALNEEDYERAAAHIHRFLAMDESLLRCTPGEVKQSEHSILNISVFADRSSWVWDRTGRQHCHSA